MRRTRAFLGAVIATFVALPRVAAVVDQSQALRAYPEPSRVVADFDDDAQRYVALWLLTGQLLDNGGSVSGSAASRRVDDYRRASEAIALAHSHQGPNSSEFQIFRTRRDELLVSRTFNEGVLRKYRLVPWEPTDKQVLLCLLSGLIALATMPLVGILLRWMRSLKLTRQVGRLEASSLTIKSLKAVMMREYVQGVSQGTSTTYTYFYPGIKIRVRNAGDNVCRSIAAHFTTAKRDGEVLSKGTLEFENLAPGESNSQALNTPKGGRTRLLGLSWSEGGMDKRLKVDIDVTNRRRLFFRFVVAAASTGVASVVICLF